MVSGQNPEVAVRPEFDGVRAMFTAAREAFDESDLVPGIASVVGDSVETGLKPGGVAVDDDPKGAVGKDHALCVVKGFGNEFPAGDLTIDDNFVLHWTEQEDD